MHPLLFKITLFSHPIEIRWYGVMIALAFLSSIHFAAWRGHKRGMDPDLIIDLGVWILVSALVGSRALYVLAEWEDYRANPLEALAFFKGGLVFYGGLLAAIPVGILYVKHKHLPVWPMADVAAPCIALGHVFGRMGCFMNGCCFGIETQSRFGMVFGPGSSAWDYFQGPAKVHPVQLYEVITELVILALILITERRRVFEGQSFALYLFAYGLARVFLEKLREGSPALLLGLTGSQLISLGLVGAGVVIAVVRLKKTRERRNRS
jgi:phosphatidylglycerol:prolipoprotein diacylglycerol transferase